MADTEAAPVSGQPSGIADLPLRQAGAALALGVISLLLAGLLPEVLGALAAEHRLSAQGIGLAATLEALTMGISTAAAGIVLNPHRLKLIAALAVLALAAADFSTLGAAGEAVMAVRMVAGVPEGLLLWIAVGMIARTVTPERWAGYFFIAITTGQLVLALLFGQWILPRTGANGGFAVLGLVSLMGLGAAFLLPRRYAALPQAAGESGSPPPQIESGAPPPRGWFALFATLVYIAATAAVSVYLQPLAQQAGLGADVARNAISVSLVAQIGGGVAATAIAGHARFLGVFVFSSLIFIGAWLVFWGHPPAWGFIAANAATGFVTILIAPFLVPMTIEADPSRRAAVLSGSTQVLANALGPFGASFVVADDNAHGAIVLGIVVLIAGLALIASLHFTSARNNHTV